MVSIIYYSEKGSDGECLISDIIYAEALDIMSAIMMFGEFSHDGRYDGNVLDRYIRESDLSEYHIILDRE